MPYIHRSARRSSPNPLESSRIDIRVQLARESLLMPVRVISYFFPTQRLEESHVLRVDAHDSYVEVAR